jgi:hypothetical protein
MPADILGIRAELHTQLKRVQDIGITFELTL